jgi:hypothetical protein
MVSATIRGFDRSGDDCVDLVQEGERRRADSRLVYYRADTRGVNRDEPASLSRRCLRGKESGIRMLDGPLTAAYGIN